MPHLKPESKTRRPSLKDPWWWTSIAVDLIDFKLGSLGKGLGKALIKDTSETFPELGRLYVDTINRCIEEKNAGSYSRFCQVRHYGLTIKSENYAKRNQVLVPTLCAALIP